MEKVIILQIASKEVLAVTINDSAGVNYIDFNNVWTGIAVDAVLGFPEKGIQNVNSVRANTTDLIHVTSYTNTIDGRATALSTQPSFIFDGAGNILYFRLPDYDDPIAYTISMGVTVELSDQDYVDEVNELQYSPDMINIPALTEEKDPLFFKELAFDEVTQNIRNRSYKYNNFIDNKLFGQLCIYFYGGKTDTFDNFIKIKQAKIRATKFVSNWDVALRLVDDRQLLSRKLPTNTLDQTTYTNLRDKFIGKAKPLIWGLVTDLPCIPLDDGAVQTNYTFLIADTTNHDINSGAPTIFMDDINKSAQVINFDETAGTFQLPAAHYDVGKEVLFTGYGFVDGASVNIENPLDIILDIFNDYLEIAYTSNTFNTTEWDSETLLANDIGLAINKSMQVIDVIKDIAAGTGIGFLLERDGRYTARSYDGTQQPVLTIRNQQWLSIDSVTQESSEVLTSATALFNKSIKGDEYPAVTDDSQETAINDEFGLWRDREFKTLYTSEADALTFAQGVMSRSNSIAKYVQGTVDDKYIDLDTVKIGKIVQAEVDVPIDTKNGEYQEFLGKCRFEIIKVTPDIQNRRVALRLRKIESIDDFTLSSFRITEDVKYRITEDGLGYRITEGAYNE